MRPLRSFLLLLIFLACFTGLHYIIPSDKLFPSLNDFFPDVLSADLNSIDTTGSKTEPELLIDTLIKATSDTVSAYDSVTVNPLDLAVYPLKNFLDSLMFFNDQARIMYYGDSQIEGDRITSFLRHTLRTVYGGTGPGLFLPVMPVMYTKSVWLNSSSNWKRFNYLSFKNGEISHHNFGPFMAICRYLPEGEKRSVQEKAYVSIKASSVADSASSVYEILRIFYGNTHDIVKVVVKSDEKELFADTLVQGDGFNEIRCLLNAGKEILIEFTGKVSPDIYGISIESEKGIIVDNLPQRGSAGLEFTMVGQENLRESYDMLSPDLIILHYGLNIVKSVKTDYSYYQKGLERQLELLRELSPLSRILVISLTDMAVNEGDSIKSYPNILPIIEAQKRASSENGVFFWDSYSAMGGKSSIIKWAERNPPLAQKDYVHFTYQGADTLSKILADDLFHITKPDSGKRKKIVILNDTPIDTVYLTGTIQSKGPDKSPLLRSLWASVVKTDPEKPLIFSAPAFWIFFLFVLAGYSLLYKKLFMRNAYLFLVSLFFYYKSGGLFLLLLLLVTIIDFSCGLLINRSATKTSRRFFILLSIISNLGILAYFKYTGFFVDTFNSLFGTDYIVYDFLAGFSNSHLGTSFNLSNIILPVGISFFTFQSLSYTFDIYRRKIEPVRNIVDFGFYVSFFPQLVAGPIVRASEFIPQLYNEFRISKREFGHALFLISKGLIKKVIISDFIAVNFIDRIFEAPSAYSGFENLMAVYGYGLQIYCDFSGYTDIAIGLALIMGFRLPINFNSPYKASGIADFWKRWHISLSRWLKDYLYIPLGGNRKGKFRAYINLIITMLLGGLWHGAALRFIIWGLLHGIGLVVGRLWNSIFGDRLKRGRAGRAFVVFLTFQFVSFCWIFFRANDMDSVYIILKQITENFSPGSFMSLLPVYGSVFLLIMVGYIIHFLPESIKESYRGLFIRIPVIAQLAVIMLVAILLYQMRTTEVIPFIYFRF